jgi:hypothetical protein
MFNVQQTLLICLVVQAGLILARRSSDTKPDIIYNQAQNGTYNIRVKVDGVTVRLPVELFEEPSYNHQHPLHDPVDVLEFGDDNKDEEDLNMDYDVSWFKTQQIKAQAGKKAANVKKSGVKPNEPPSKLMRFLLRTLSQNRGAAGHNNN